MSAKEKRTIVQIKFSDPKFISRETFEAALNRADLTIKYKSFYKEEFIYSSENEKSNIQVK